MFHESELVLERPHLRPDPRPRIQFTPYHSVLTFHALIPRLYWSCFHPLRFEPKHSP